MPQTTDSRWGVMLWGGSLWGDAPDIDYQGAQAKAKPDTRLLIDGGTYTTDLSQIGASMTSDSGMAYTTGSGITADAPICIEGVFTADSSSVGYLAWIGDGSDATMIGVLVTSGALRLIYDGTSTDAALPNVSGTIDEYAFCITIEGNPLTTGAGDAVMVSVAVCDTDDVDSASGWTITRATDGAISGTASRVAVGGNYISGSAGGVYDTGSTGELTTLRIGVRAHSVAEMRYDLVDSVTPAIITGEQPPALPRWTDTIGDEGAMVGPAYRMAGAHHIARRMTYMGPAWQFAANTPADIDLDANDLGLAAGDIAWTYSPAGVGLTGHIGWLASPPVPPLATHVKAWVKVSSDAASPASTSTTIGIVSQSRLPGTTYQIGAPLQDLKRYYTNATWDHDSQDTDGDWVELDSIRVAQDETGHTWLWVGVDDSTGGAEVRIEAVSVNWTRELEDTDPPEGLLIP